MINWKRVYDAPAEDDGYRVLVDRLWPRGIKKCDLACDEWCKTLAPSTELRKAFHSGTLDFAAFTEQYRAELAGQREDGKRLAALAKTQNLTLLYAAKNSAQNHAQVLAAWLGDMVNT
ncbi:DUF488 domain-containing protein [Enterobacter sp.]|uniref:DUF488 domain-containing protein n=1 Tax=Enterobacter sp. TaxID=42895 RepID=UPI00296F59A0|nr:DUF488 domain-containing protein [Enterobacter sp.]